VSAQPAPVEAEDGVALTDEWDALADGLRAPPSLYPGYVAAWTQSREQPPRRPVLTVRDGGSLAGVLPLVDHGRGRAGGIAEAECVGVLARDDDTALILARAALDGRWRSVRLRPVPEGGRSARAFAAAARALGGHCATRPVEVRPVIDAGEDWAAYWAARGGNLRKDIGRRRRRLSDAGEWGVEVHRDTEGLGSLLDEAFRVEASGWKADRGTAITSDPEAAEQYRLLAHWAACRGWLRLAMLRLDGRAIAMQYGVEAHGVSYALKIGFDEEFASLSPGKVLLASEIERCFAEGVARFDFAGAVAGYKTAWATGEERYDELFATPPGVAGRLVWTAERGRAWVRPRAKAARTRLRERRGDAA
jgi:CelD/BcsL family acetyltransferase involved in cellulose biosynthesis